MKLFTIGYGLWPPAQRMEKLLECLHDAGVRLLIDTRHSPCASQVDAKSHYSQRPWHLQAGRAGIAAELHRHGIDYRWLVELGNPQKNDKTMRVFKEQLASQDERWPVTRGLELLRALLMPNRPAALLCACADWRKCHRTLIAEAAQTRFPELGLEIAHLP